MAPPLHMTDLPLPTIAGNNASYGVNGTLPNVTETFDEKDSLMIYDFVRGGPPRAEFLGFAQRSHYDFDHSIWNVNDGESFVPRWVVVCGYLAVICSMMVTYAAYPTIQKIQKTKTVGTLPLLPFSIMIAKAFAWIIYGSLKSEPKLWLPNLLALPYAIMCFRVYALYSPSEGPHLPGKLSHHVFFTGAIVAVIAVSAVVFPSSIAVNIVGMSAVMVNVIRDWSPLVALPEVIKNKSADSISAPQSIACCFDNALWIIYGKIVMDDALVYVPNAFRFCLTASQVVLVLVYGKKRKRIERHDSDPVISVDGVELKALMNDDLLEDEENVHTSVATGQQQAVKSRFHSSRT